MTWDDIWTFLMNAFEWLGLGLALLCVVIIWVIIIFVVVDEIISIYREFRKPKDDDDYYEYGGEG